MNFTDYAFETSTFLDKDVIVGNAEQISYPALYREVCRIAAHLNRIAGEDQKILLIGENSVFFVAAYLGIIKSGNVCVPVNPKVIEIPTPRWTAYDAKYYGVKPLPGTRMTIQERAYTSPIWYSPQSDNK